MNWDTERVVQEHSALIDAFRRQCQADGYSEAQRAPLRAKDNPTLRFINSSISVLIQHCAYEETPPLFLLQPALRLRNQAHVDRTGQMSSFGCYFVAFGMLAPPAKLSLCFREFEAFFLDRLRLPAERLVLRATREDKDFLRLLADSRVKIELDGCEMRLFRHTFGSQDISGRNINIAISSRGALWDVANLIVIERKGLPGPWKAHSESIIFLLDEMNCRTRFWRQRQRH